MSTLRNNPLAKAIRFALIGGAASVVAVPAFAADEAAAEEEGEQRIEVTGSRIKRSDIEGALPVSVIDREQIELSGEISVADLLRNTTFNSFGSFRPQSGSSAQSFAELSLRGLGGGRTLILIDGRRAPVSPDTGVGQDLNSIPLAAVERVEILTDGASAIYGTDAIAGVVNIITRKDFEGVEAMIGMGSPEWEGGDTEEGSVMFGASSDKARLIGGFSKNNRDIIFQKDRPWSSGGVSSYSNALYSAIAAPGTLYGWRAGGTISNPTYGNTVPGFDCDSPSNPGFFTNGATGAAERCFYDFTFVAADEAQYGTEALFLRGEYEINENWTTYMNSSVAHVESFGRYAPVPSSPWPGGSIFLPVGSPNHPAVLDPAAGYNAAVPYFMRHRFAALGNRDTLIDKNTYSAMWGAEGTIGDLSLDFGGRISDSQFIELGRNYVVGGLAQEAISSGRYNVQDPFNNPRDVMDAMIATINRDSRSVVREFYVNASLDLFEMAGGTSAIAFGAETREEEYQDIYDSLQSSGQIVGSAGNSAGGGRDVNAAYFEAVMPFFDGFEASVAARYDEYSDYGSDTSPKVSVRWQVLDSLTLRASWGEGFRAPTLDIVTAQPAFSADGISDPATCLANGLPAGCQMQITAYSLANPNLTSEQSEQYSMGLAWEATSWLNMTVDYYNIMIDGRIAAVSSGTIADCLLGTTTNCPSGLSYLDPNANPPVPSAGLGVARDPVTQEIIYAQRGSVNLGTLETNGVDLNVVTKFDFGGAGRLTNDLSISYANEYLVDGADQIGLAGYPQFRAILANTWAFDDFSFALNINHIDETASSDPNGDYGYATTVPAWTTYDVQANWNAPWNGKLTVGIDNVTGEEPALDPLNVSGRGYDQGLYDAYGKNTYVRYTQTF